MISMNPFDRTKYPNCYRGHEYAERIVAGDILASRYVIGACKRYLKDISDEFHPNFYFDVLLAEKYLRIVQQFDHVIGEWKINGVSSKKIIYQPWQCWVWMNIMGFVSRKTGKRRFRTAHLELARGNGKSPMASQCCLYFVGIDGSQGNQIACAATKKDQARIVFDASRAMAKKNESFLKVTGVKVLAHTIVHEKSNSVVRPLSSEAGSLDGLNDVLSVLDELHAMKQATFDVITSGTAKRNDSLALCITTAGFDQDSVGYYQSTYAKKICIGEVEDDTFFAAVYTLDMKDEQHGILEDDDIYDPKNWIKANPNWGISVDVDKFASFAEKTKSVKSDLRNFKVKHLNLWEGEALAFFDVNKWDACADPTLDIKNFYNKKCRTGLDLASKVDLCCYVHVFYENGIYYLFDKCYLPEERIKLLKNPLFDTSVEDGFLIATSGEVINNEKIREDILADAKKFKIEELLYDKWNATEMSQALAKKSVEVVQFAQTTGNFSEPMKKLDELIRSGKVRHNGSPLMRWCLMNVVSKPDANDNVFPRKTHERLKIDPIVAAIMALGGWIQDEQKDSIYESRGLRFV